MASNYTSNYSLCQWEPDDKVLRTEFNADNVKIDAALAGLEGSKASVSALNSLQSALDSKITGLQSTVSSQGTALALRNCCFVTGTYTGDGTEGEASVVAISFSRKPVYVRINSSKDVRSVCAVRGQSNVLYSLSNMTNQLAFTWGAKSVSWHGVYTGSRLTADTHLNRADTTYHYFAILEL